MTAAGAIAGRSDLTGFSGRLCSLNTRTSGSALRDSNTMWGWDEAANAVGDNWFQCLNEVSRDVTRKVPLTVGQTKAYLLYWRCIKKVYKKLGLLRWQTWWPSFDCPHPHHTLSTAPLLVANNIKMGTKFSVRKGQNVRYSDCQWSVELLEGLNLSQGAFSLKHLNISIFCRTFKDCSLEVNFICSIDFLVVLPLVLIASLFHVN